MVLGFQGAVEVQRAENARWDPTYTNQVLDAGNRLRTDKNSQALLRFSDLETIRIGPRSLIRIESKAEVGRASGDVDRSDRFRGRALVPRPAGPDEWCGDHFMARFTCAVLALRRCVRKRGQMRLTPGVTSCTVAAT